MKKLIMSIMALIAISEAMAKVNMPNVLTDGMVLQQQTEVKLWGTAKEKSEVKITTSWNRQTYKTNAGADGHWSLKVATPCATKTPQSITVTDGDKSNGEDGKITIQNILIGEVWLCSGQSNMDMRMRGRYGDPVIGALDAVATSGNQAIRMFTVGAKMDNTPHDDCRGEWQEASPATVPGFSAAAYFFARKLNEVLGVPVGILHASYGGSRVEAWMSNEAAAPYKQMPEVENASILYNGMMSPLVGYGIRGLLWYQGEANVNQPDLYTRLFPAMINDWRERWGVGEFPVVYAQIAPHYYNKGNGKGENSAYLREAQVKCLKLIPSSSMICLLDAGSPKTIHPMDKRTVGQRFAYMALQKVYGFKGYTAETPAYKKMTVEGNKVTIEFTGTEDGMTSFRRPLTDFEVAGEDRVFYPAQAWFGKDMKVVEIRAAQVEKPVAVRYAFKDYADGSLFNIWGIPVSSFRTDDWE